MATIKDIAKQTGYGVGTVSRALNGGQGVSPHALKAILESAERIGYSPNTYARNLVKGDFESKTIGLLMMLDSNTYLYEMLRGIYNVLNNLGYNILMFSVGSKRERIINHIIAENLCGLFVIATPLRDDEKKIFSLNNIPYIYLDYYETNENYIAVDNYRGGSIAAEHLLSRECKKIAYIGETRASEQQNERLRGFGQTLKRNGSRLFLSDYVNVTFNSSFSDLKKRCTTTVERLSAADVDGIFCYSDELAIAILQETKRQGKKINIIGYDDIPAAEYFSLTTVHQPLERMGEEAAKEIVNLSTPPKEPIERFFKPKLVLRDT